MTKQLEQGCNDLAVNMDDSLAQRLMLFSEQLQMPLWLIIQNLLLADWARRCASFEVEGFSPPRIIPEFAREQLEDGTEQVITGESLWNSLVEVYKKELIAQKNNIATLEAA